MSWSVRPADPDSVARYLSEHRMFGVLGAAGIGRLLPHVVQRLYPKYHRLYYRGEPTAHIHLVVSGLVVSTEEREDGKLCVRQFFTSGDVLSTAAALLDHAHMGTAISLADSDLLLIPRAVFDGLWPGCPEMVRAIVHDLYDKLRRAEQRRVNASVQGAAARVADLLLSIASKTGSLEKEPAAIELGLTQEDVAFLDGSSRETVSRVLGQLARRKLVAVGRRRIVLLKPDSLATIAKGHPAVTGS